MRLFSEKFPGPPNAQRHAQENGRASSGQWSTGAFFFWPYALLPPQVPWISTYHISTTPCNLH
jgi:hypothetical protein